MYCDDVVGIRSSAFRRSATRHEKRHKEKFGLSKLQVNPYNALKMRDIAAGGRPTNQNGGSL
jgi:hypothetical protein